ncbi:MAG: tetratricopeptide repeat protein, partial [Planctomycetes bacterium]|nr:tetratricopeptide repeat protein [Planctomycetota bacterium]
MVLHLLASLPSFVVGVVVAAQALLGQNGPQLPAPGAEAAIAAHVGRGRDLLDSEDPVGAWDAFRKAAMAGADPRECLHGLGRAHLMLGHSAFAVAYAEAGLRCEPADQDAMALCVRALIRARRFDEAVATAGRFVQRTERPNAELLAARASSLFRVQRIDEAAASYKKAVGLDPQNAEGHLRLGSGL